jgi:hypothetical protein
MSLFLEPYVVDLAVVRGAVGSGDVRTRRSVGGRFKSRMAADDEYFADLIADGAPKRYDALRAVVDGGPFDAEHGFQYGYAYRMICEFHGRAQANHRFAPFRWGWLERVDDGLRELGVTAVDVSSFGYSLPDPLPGAESPRYGEWSARECALGLEQWEAAAPERRAALDPEVLEAAEQCAGWMRAAVAREGFGVAGFMY